MKIEVLDAFYLKYFICNNHNNYPANKYRNYNKNYDIKKKS